MILVQRVQDNSKVIITELVEYDNEAIEKAKQKAEVFRDKNVLLSDFSDKVWTLYNGKRRFTIKFDFDEIIFTKECKGREFYTFEEFINSVKSYLILVLDTISLHLAQVFITMLKKVSRNTFYFCEDMENNWLNDINSTDGKYVSELALVRDFANYIQVPGITKYRDRLTIDVSELSRISSKKRKEHMLQRRKLADFQSVFLFDRSIGEYWDTATTVNKLKYYPLYLWWKITNILPLRVTEFLLTPYDCIKRKDNGNYTITVRRSKIKGTGRKRILKKIRTITHSVEGDYKLYTYPITSKIAELVLDFISLTEEHRKDYEKKYLFLNSEYNNPMINFTITTLDAMLKRFEVEILQNEMGLTLRHRKESETNVNEQQDDEQYDDDAPLPINELFTIRLGDTRHFSMINMVLNDFNPILVKDFAGHLDVNTSYHYFENIAELVKCISYNKYKELCEYDADTLITTNQAKITGNRILNALSKEDATTIKLDNGECSSKEFVKNSIKDCQIVGGDCEKCDYFTRTTKETKEERVRKMRALEDEIREEGKFLGSILSSYKDNMEDNKVIAQSIARLQSKAEVYLQDVKLNGGYYE